VTGSPATVRCEHLEGQGVARLTLTAGRGNVLTITVLEELARCARELGGDPSLRAILLDAEGPDFSFGVSVREHLAESAAAMLAAVRGAAEALLAPDLPLLVAARGRCLGGGLELALLGDRLVAAPGAEFGSPEIRLGVFAPLASLLLPRSLGPRRAFELLVGGRALHAERARELGLVSDIAEDPAAAQLAWVRVHLAPHSPFALRQATRAARACWAPRFLEDLAGLERQYLEELMAHPDPEEGLRAFLEKRPPRWRDA
jgi:cyclohexa-1,5-dienecarbonyl-CoA hydratase